MYQIMNRQEIKQLLDEKYREYCNSDFFIHTDPIQIPKMFEEKEDIEISGFMAASLAWGQRPVIIKKCRELMQLMDYAPYDFIMHQKRISTDSGILYTVLSMVTTVVILYNRWLIFTGITEVWNTSSLLPG